ncbi:GNAT family N-acetyltransferase [Paenibacillus sp. LMG 31459]|uniref:GNAT family N-acetyltransferase n=1 Tax=Paenibacillus phytohabitans TaxID=2654978 RepID=A0ABX1YDR3_9BACL|nr:GNAT family N-acetyltransferase [Paenibacillus phytohabitans]
MKVFVEKANIDDAELLAEIQRDSFDDESRTYNNNEPGGPEGYDSIDSQIEFMKQAHYYKILKANEIVGGVIVYVNDSLVYNLGRIYINPIHQNQGIGHQVMKLIEANYPEVQKWWLDTPNWSISNHYFYEKNGYVKIKEEHGLFIYEKCRSVNC